MSQTNPRVRFIILSLALSIGASLALAAESGTAAPDAKAKAEDRSGPQKEAKPSGQLPVARAQRVCPSTTGDLKVNTLEELLAGDATQFLLALEPKPAGSPAPETQPRKDAQPAESAE